MLHVAAGHKREGYWDTFGSSRSTLLETSSDQVKVALESVERLLPTRRPRPTGPTPTQRGTRVAQSVGCGGHNRKAPIIVQTTLFRIPRWRTTDTSPWKGRRNIAHSGTKRNCGYPGPPTDADLPSPRRGRWKTLGTGSFAPHLTSDAIRARVSGMWLAAIYTDRHWRLLAQSHLPTNCPSGR